MSDKLQELGIPPHEVTPSVSIAVNGLLDHINQLNHNLQQVKHEFENLQSMVDVDSASNTIANRKALVKRLNWSLAMSKRYSGPTSVVVFKINEFENIGRTYGYQATDKLGNHVAEYIATNIRDTDFFARMEDSRFGAIMYFAEFNDVKAKAEKLCENIRGVPLCWNNALVNITLSYGVHSLNPADDAESALTSAISALYVNDSKQKFEQINFKA